MDIVLALAGLAAGLVLLEWGADHFTDGIGGLARRLRASESVVGLLTAGGEWEELVVVVLALIGGHGGLAVGDIIGSCIANLTGSMPLGFLGSRPLVLDRSARIYAGVMLGATVLAAGFLAGGSVRPIAGVVLLIAFAIYVASVLLVIRRGWLRPPEPGDDDDNDAGGLVLAVGLLLFSLVVISVGAEFVVLSAVHVAHRAGLSEYAIGATLVALATTLPDKAMSLIGGLRGRSGVVTSNATGSNIFLLTLVLGLGAIGSGSGLKAASTITHVDIPILLAVTVLVVLLFQRATLHRRSAITLLTIYAGYLIYALLRGS